ncbi:GntR family transcriptional regulator [Kyrpidia spormannii]|uniref:GntR family transcriptional regulator n=1 Tax=Kyrpidia spormannii TaxID=2055160 RepID=A0A2K8N3L8_9BACL|nr:GntR family transcriptional regulator [Kyrpidia spormannii]
MGVRTSTGPDSPGNCAKECVVVAGPHSEGLSRYEQIAVDIAQKIASQEYTEGMKLHGRSTLASQYNVSPETIRRAISVLDAAKVVRVQPGVGIVVLSKRAAELFLSQMHFKRTLEELHRRLTELVEKRRVIDNEIDQVLHDIQHSSHRYVVLHDLLHCVAIPEGSPVIGKTLRELSFRNVTGATVVSIERSDRAMNLAAGEAPLSAGDLLWLIAEPGSLAQVERLLGSGPQM